MTFRLKFSFWLNLDEAGQGVLADTIAELKEKRLFASTVRDGIRLICDLRAGKIDSLFELFPGLHTQLISSAQANLEFEQIVQQAVASALGKQEDVSVSITKETKVILAASAVTADKIASNFVNSMKGIASDWFG